MAAQWDILGIGCATVDEFLRVDVFPTPDTKKEVLGVDRQGGGLGTTATVAAARLGAKCTYFDVLGMDDLSNWVIEDLAAYGMDLSLIVRRPEARPIRAVIIVTADGSRTILYTLEGRVMRAEDLPSPEVIRQARVFLLDDVNAGALDGLAHRAAAAREAGVPVVADIELTHHAGLIEAVDHLIVSARWATGYTGIAEPAEAACALWRQGRSVVVVTCGDRGSYAYAGEGAPLHIPAFSVQAVDTTGCGDVFHGAYAAALTWGLPLEERLRAASAAAALKATRLGGRPGIPTRDQLEAFLRG